MKYDYHVFEKRNNKTYTIEMNCANKNSKRNKFVFYRQTTKKIEI